MNISNLENVLQRNLRTDRVRECIFRELGGTIWKMYPLGAFIGFDVLYGCAQKNSGYVTVIKWCGKYAAIHFYLYFDVSIINEFRF